MKHYLPHKFAPHPVNHLDPPEWIEEPTVPESIQFPFPLETLDAEGVPEIGYRTLKMGEEYWQQYFQFISYWLHAGWWWWVMAKPAIADREFDEVERRISYYEREVLDELKPYKGFPLPMGNYIRRFHPMWSEERYPAHVRDVYANCPVRLRFPWRAIEDRIKGLPVQEKTFAKRPPKIR
jgi:hypothetical protein